MCTAAEAAGSRVSWVAGSASLSSAGSGRCRGTSRVGLQPPAPTRSELLSSSSVICSRPAPAGDWKSRAPGRGKPASQGRSPAQYLGLLGWPQGESSRRQGCRGWLKVSRLAGRRHPAEGTSGSWGSQAQGARRWPPPLRLSGWWTGRLHLQSLQQREGRRHSPLSPTLCSQDEVPMAAAHPGPKRLGHKMQSQSRGPMEEQGPPRSFCGEFTSMHPAPWSLDEWQLTAKLYLSPSWVPTSE